MSKKARQYKLITTTSGAHYVVDDDGRVVRFQTAISMVHTLDNFQYQEGFLQEGFLWEDIKEGYRMHWMGVRYDKYTEPIASSLVDTVVTTDSSNRLACFAVDAYLEEA